MPTLVVQLGHCYRKSGATGTAGEQDFATLVGEACRYQLHGRDGWTVRRILADDPVGSYAGDAFVAIHCDGSTSPAARGASVGYRTPEGQQLGQAWKRAYAARGWPGFRPDNYTPALANYYGTGTAVARGNRAAVIVECGFLTNADDRAQLTAPGGADRVALAIGDALGITAGQPGEDEDMPFGVPNPLQWEPGVERWGVIAVPPVGRSLSVGAGGQAWVHLRCPNRPVTLHGMWFVGTEGQTLQFVDERQLDPDRYHRWQLPKETMQVSVLYTAEVPIGATLETRY